MKSILIFSQYPGEIDNQALSTWSSAVNKIQEKSKRDAKIQMLGKGAWLIPEGSDMSFLGEAATVLKEWSIGYQVILIEQSSEWYSNKPK